MSLTENRLFTFAMGANSIPCKEATRVFHGAMVGVQAGYGRPLEAGDVFAGHNVGDMVDNRDGDNGDKDIQLRDGDSYRLVVEIADVIQENVGSYVYASADDTYTLTSDGNSLVGVLVRVRSIDGETGVAKCEVLFQPFIS